MSDDNYSTAPHHAVQRLLNHMLRVGVQGGGGLVQQQDAWPAKEHKGEGEYLISNSTVTWTQHEYSFLPRLLLPRTEIFAAPLILRTGDGTMASNVSTGRCFVVTAYFLTRARAIAIRCFWPPDICTPLSPQEVWYPLGSSAMKLWALASLAASSTSCRASRQAESRCARTYGALLRDRHGETDSVRTSHNRTETQ